jgi:hypothetical protein
MACWILAHNDRTIGALHTAEAHRKKGFAKIVRHLWDLSREEREGIGCREKEREAGAERKERRGKGEKSISNVERLY